ncbi:retrovirus-related pol polyprotein from transposon TNT 1-94 [Tanacetum coccineum]|uniref:Retrovirus-related pol polyprotein from transposon TNT 1-94 n=1 Tax=Tanacetum coccineum TaxID=301880 RepID=A0ABQ5GTN1_9ASTR
MDSDKYLEGQSMQRPPLFESDSNSQVKDNKIDLLVQQYEQFVISEDESIDSAFARFNTIITTLKAPDEGYSSTNYVRKFLRDLHPKWREKVMTIEESKDLTSLSLDELIGNLKVHEIIVKKDSKIVKEKVERKSIALKAKKEYSDEECWTSGSKDEEYAMASDSDEEDEMKVKDETCLVAHASSEVGSESSYFSDENSSIGDLALDNEYDKLCKMSLKIITKNKRLKATRNSLENRLRKLKDKLSTLEENKGVDLDCAKCYTLKIENEKLKEQSTRLNKFEKSTHCLNEMLSSQKPSGDKLGLEFNSFEASSSGTKEIKFVKAQKKSLSDGGPINIGGPLSDLAAPKIIMGPPPATPGSEKTVSFQKSILGPRPKNIIVNKAKVPVASDNEVKQFYKPLSKLKVGFSKPNFRSKTPPSRKVNNNYPRAKTPQPKRNIGRQNRPHGFPMCLRVNLEPDEWIKDSGCSKHMMGNRKLFSTYKAYNGGNVIFGSNLRGNIIGKCTISNDSLRIDNVEHVDNFGFNLLSIGQICDNKCRVTFSEHDSEITKDGTVICRGIRKKGLYVIKLGNKPKNQICLATIDENSTLCHRRLGHVNMRLIQSLASKKLVRNLPKLKFDQHFCDACKIGKQAHVSHKAKNIVSTTRCLELIHMDLFGPSAVWSYGGNRYTLVIVDDYSKYTWTRFLKDKTEAFDQFKIFSRKIQNQLGCSILSIRTDHRREFDNDVQFGDFCNTNGITHNFSAPRTPQSNGVIVRKNGTLQEMSRTMLNEQSLPQKFWCNAVYTSTYILNRILIRAILGKTPYELLRGRKPTKVDESLNVTFDETPPPFKTSPLVDDDLDEEEAIKVTEKKNLENDIVDETLEIDEIVNIKESRNHPLENVIGNLNQRTLRLVAQGYNQQEGIDYDETYAPVARLESIRILLAYACALDFKLFQMDVKSAFLNGFINEEVYVAQPSRFIDFKKPDHVYKLKKALYGLKQAPKAWYDRLKAFLIKHEYKMGMVDNTLFTKKKSLKLTIVQIYIDDIIFGSNFQDMCDEFSKIMLDEFEMSMMGELNFFLGLQIEQMEDGIFFNKSKYIKEMLKKFGLEESKPMKTPTSSNTKLAKDEECESIDSTKYQGMIGSLLYLTASRPDIMFSAYLYARFQEAPKTSHLEAVKRIFRYIKSTTHLGLWYPKGTDIETVVYADSDHARDYVDQKCTSGICTFVGCCLTFWFSKKQTALAISTPEAEYVSAGKACQQALWMKQALIDYDVRLDDVPIMCDNKGVIDLSKNPVQHSCTKHIEIRHHFLRDNVQKGHISIKKVPFVDNIVSILMKPLKRESFNYLQKLRNLEERYIHEGRVVFDNFTDINYVRSLFHFAEFECLLEINEQVCPRFILDFYSQYCLSYSDEGQMFIEFVIQNQYFSLFLEDFAQNFKIPCEGACVFSDRWSLDELVYGAPSEGPYQTNLPSPDDIILYVREDREGQVTRIHHQEEVMVQHYQILTCEIVSTLKPLEEIIWENIFCLGGNRDHVLACLCYMLYCVANSERFNLAYFMEKRIEWVTKQAMLILPYGMLLTRLFDIIIGENSEFQNESYVLYDRVMNPLAAQLEQKPRRDHGTRKGRPSTSSSTFDQPSSSYLKDDDDGNNKGTSHASTPSPIRYVNSLTNQVPQVFQNPPNIDPHLEPFYTRQTEIINRQVQLRDEQRGEVRSIGKNLRRLWRNMKKSDSVDLVSTNTIRTSPSEKKLGNKIDSSLCQVANYYGDIVNDFTHYQSFLQRELDRPKRYAAITEEKSHDGRSKVHVTNSSLGLVALSLFVTSRSYVVAGVLQLIVPVLRDKSGQVRTEVMGITLLVKSGQLRPSLNNENGGKRGGKRVGMPLLSPSLHTECLQNLSLGTGPSHSRTSSQLESSNVEGMRERKCEGEVVDDMFNAYLNLNNLGRLNTFKAENGEDLDSRANGTKANGGDSSDNEATSSLVGSCSNNMQRSGFCSVSDKREGIKRSAGGDIAPTTRHYIRVSIDSVW